MAASSQDIILGVGIELFLLGIATGVAGISDEVGTMMVIFMTGLFLIWFIAHAGVFSNLFGGQSTSLLNQLRAKGAI